MCVCWHALISSTLLMSQLHRLSCASHVTSVNLSFLLVLVAFHFSRPLLSQKIHKNQSEWQESRLTGSPLCKGLVLFPKTMFSWPSAPPFVALWTKGDDHKRDICGLIGMLPY
jgi:hypothetical protein